MSNIEEVLNRVYKSESYAKLRALFPNIDFDKEIQENTELAEYIRSAVNSIAPTTDNPLVRPDAPKLN
jgi:hypothetical protein